MTGMTFPSTMALFAGGTGLVMRFEIVAAVYSADTKFYSKNALTYVSEVRVFLKQNEGIFCLGIIASFCLKNALILFKKCHHFTHSYMRAFLKQNEAIIPRLTSNFVPKLSSHF
jgi:hypothetical protein